jgi:hypothetical protein
MRTFALVVFAASLFLSALAQAPDQSGTAEAGTIATSTGYADLASR